MLFCRFKGWRNFWFYAKIRDKLLSKVTASCAKGEGRLWRHEWLVKIFYFPSVELNPISRKGMGCLTLLGRGGAESARPFFTWLFLHEKRGLKVSNFMTFPNSWTNFNKIDHLMQNLCTRSHCAGLATQPAKQLFCSKKNWMIQII